MSRRIHINSSKLSKMKIKSLKNLLLFTIVLIVILFIFSGSEVIPQDCCLETIPSTLQLSSNDILPEFELIRSVFQKFADI